MFKTFIFAASALAVAAVALIRRWRRRPDTPMLTDGDAVSEEWLSHARGQPDDRW